RPADAEADLRRAIDADPSYREAHYTLYLCLVQQGKAREAEGQAAKLKQVEQDLKRLFELVNADIPRNPHDPALLYEVGMICARKNEPQGALYWLHNALKKDIGYRPAHQALADCYERLGDKERAAHHRQLGAPAPK